MLLHGLVEASAGAKKTRSRTAKTRILAEAITRAHEDGQGALATAYLSGAVPQRRLGVGWRSLRALPEPAAEPQLTLADVDLAFDRLAREIGVGSLDRRAAAVDDLFSRATGDEQRFLVALMTGELRHGALDGVVLGAKAQAAGVPVDDVRRASMLAGSTPVAAAAALAGGRSAVREVGLTVGRPVRPMLAASAPDLDAALAGRGGEVGFERKVDGIRLQVHVRGEHVRLFTRTLEDVTDRMPEIVAAARAWPVRAAVVDGEVIALRPDGRPHPFQITGARTASRTDPALLAERTPLTPAMFDVLHVDGVDLLDLPSAERAAHLARIVPPEQRIDRIVGDAARGQNFFDRCVADGHEGVVVKDLDAPYAAGRRGAGWVKVKPRLTLDLVVVAVEWGSGRRAGLLSNIYLAAREGDRLVMLGKTFKGMTDEMLRWQTRRFLDLETSREGHIVHVRPEQVVEIAFDGLQTSTRYPGGLALRFARVLRYRDDVSADTMETVRALARR